MNKSTLSSSRIFFILAAFLVSSGISSCTNQAQQFLFSNHPTEYKKAEQAAPALTPAETAPLTAGNSAEPTVILPPDAYAQEEAKSEALAAELLNNRKSVSQPAEFRKVTLKEKIAVTRMAMKEVKAAKQEIKQLKKADVKATKAGPVSNDLAIKIIILGLIIALLGIFVGPLGGLGGLIVLVGLVLLLLNYL